MIHTLIIPDWHPATINQLQSGHWTHGYKLKKRDRHLVEMYSFMQKVPKTTVKRRVTLTLHLTRGQRSVDVDAPFKSLLDALKHAGMIMNDSPKWVEISPLQYRRDGTPKRSIILLEDMM